MKLKEITICGIRGFNVPQTIQLDNDRVLVYGPNGSGKSSIVEAIEWLLYGGISRKALSDCKSEYSGEYIKNKHYSGKTKPHVEVTFVKDGKLLSLRREYTSVSTSQTFINGKEAEFSTLGYLNDESCKPIMSQAEVRRFVESQRKDKWNEILRIIGLQVLGELRDDIFQLVTNKKNDSLFIEAKSFCNQIVAGLKQFKKTRRIISNIGKWPYSEEEVIESVAQSLGITDPSSFTVEALKKSIRIRMEKIIQPESLATLDIPTDTFSSITLKDTLKHMDAVLQLLGRRTDVDRDFIDFISTGLKYVSDTICPFCKKKTLTKKRRKELEQLVSISQKKLELESQLEEEIVNQKYGLQFIIAMVHDFISKKRELPNVIEMLEKTGRYTEDVCKLSEVSRTWFSDLEDMLSSFEPQLRKYLAVCEEYLSGKLKYDAVELEKLKQDIERTIKKIWRLASERASDLAQIRQSILLKTTDVERSLELLRKLLLLEQLLSKKDLIKTFAIFKSFE